MADWDEEKTRPDLIVLKPPPTEDEELSADISEALVDNLHELLVLAERGELVEICGVAIKKDGDYFFFESGTMSNLRLLGCISIMEHFIRRRAVGEDEDG